MIVIPMAVIIEYFENYWFVLINFLLSYIEYIFGITLDFYLKENYFLLKNLSSWRLNHLFI